jgi:hypothetical protein
VRIRQSQIISIGRLEKTFILELTETGNATNRECKEGLPIATPGVLIDSAHFCRLRIQKSAITMPTIRAINTQKEQTTVMKTLGDVMNLHGWTRYSTTTSRKCAPQAERYFGARAHMFIPNYTLFCALLTNRVTTRKPSPAKMPRLGWRYCNRDLKELKENEWAP